MSVKRVLQLFKRREAPSDSPSSFVAKENMGIQDTSIQDTPSLEEQEYERARQELSQSQAEVARLRAEYMALTEKVRLAEQRFQHALQALHSVRLGRAS